MARPEKGRRTAQTRWISVEQGAAHNDAPPYKPGLSEIPRSLRVKDPAFFAGNSAGTDALYLSFALWIQCGRGGKNSGFCRGKIFIIAFHLVLSHHKNLVFDLFAICAPFRAFFTTSVKKQILTLAPKSAMSSRRNRRRTLLPIPGADRRQDTDHLHGTPALWARELVWCFRLFDQIVARHIAEQQLEL